MDVHLAAKALSGFFMKFQVIFPVFRYIQSIKLRKAAVYAYNADAFVRYTFMQANVFGHE